MSGLRNQCDSRGKNMQPPLNTLLLENAVGATQGLWKAAVGAVAVTNESHSTTREARTLSRRPIGSAAAGLLVRRVALLLLVTVTVKTAPPHVYRQQVTSTEASVTQHTRADIRIWLDM